MSQKSPCRRCTVKWLYLSVPPHLLPDFTAAENVMLPADGGMARSKALAQAGDVERLVWQRRVHHRPSVSGGSVSGRRLPAGE